MPSIDIRCEKCGGLLEFRLYWQLWEIRVTPCDCCLEEALRDGKLMGEDNAAEER